MTNNLQKLFSILCLVYLINATGDSTTNLTTEDIRQRLANYISSKNQVNHIDRKQITGGQEVLRKEKNHKVVLKELVQQNNYQIIANDQSQFLNEAMKYSNSFEKVKEFAKEMALIMKVDVQYQLQQTLEETLTKLLTLVSQNYIGQRDGNFYYLYDFNSFRSFLHDLQDKSIRFENQCEDENNEDLIQCKYYISACYKSLYEHFAQFQLAQVTSPEFKDKYEEMIDAVNIDDLDVEQIQEIALMHIKNIQQGANGIMQKLKVLVQDLVTRRNNVLSKFYESYPSKQKVYENIINFMNRKLIIKNSQDHFLNFYSYHFIVSLEKLLANAYKGQQNEHKFGMIIPYLCFVYERVKIETLIKDAKALSDYVQAQEDKTLDSFQQNINDLINFFSGLDNTQSSSYILEPIKTFKKQQTTVNSQLKSQMNLRNTVLKTQSQLRNTKPLFQQTVKHQTLKEQEKEEIRNDIMNYHQKVPKSELVKLFVNFRKVYEATNIHKKKTCERSFYEFLQASGRMFLGSSTLNYQGAEINDFQDKLIKKILEFQDCLDKKVQNDLSNIKEELQTISDRVNKLYRLNHDFIELKIEYKLDAIKRKLNLNKQELNQEDLNQIKVFQDDIKKDFLRQKNIKDFNGLAFEQSGQKKTVEPLQQPIVNGVQTNEQNIQNQSTPQEIDFQVHQERQAYMDDIDDTNNYDRPEMKLNKIHLSNLETIFKQIDDQDKQNKYINLFKSYQKDLHFLINSINDLDESIEKNEFNQNNKGTWVTFKIPEEKVQELLNQSRKLSQDVQKIYSTESDNMYQVQQQLQNYIKQNLHKTRGYYYDRKLIQNNEDSESLNDLNLDGFEIENVKNSKLYPILKSIIYNLYQVVENNGGQKESINQGIEMFKEALNDLINDDNLQLEKRMSKRYNKKLNYGKYKFASQKVTNCNDKLDGLLDMLNDQSNEAVLDLKDDIESFKNFFNKQKRTRANIYETTDAQYDDNKNFIGFEEAESEESESQNLSEDKEIEKQIQNTIIQEQSNEQSSEEIDTPLKLMNIEKIEHSKIYSPLKSIQSQKFKNQREVDLYNHIASEFNEMMEYENLVQTGIQKIKKQKVKIGTYHYQADKANSFLNYLTQLRVLIEQEDDNEILKQDLSLVIDQFNTFISTRKFYHEAFSAVLIDNEGNEISKPLYNTDFDKLSQSNFSMISDTGLDIQNALNESLLNSDEKQSSSESSQEHSSDSDTQRQKVQIQSNKNGVQKKVKRRIYVMDIVTCEDCIKNGYVEVIKK